MVGVNGGPEAVSPSARIPAAGGLEASGSLLTDRRIPSDATRTAHPRAVAQPSLYFWPLVSKNRITASLEVAAPALGQIDRDHLSVIGRTSVLSNKRTTKPPSKSV